MPNIEFSHAKRLFNSLCKYTDEQTAENIACSLKMSKTPTVKKRFEWAENVCAELSEHFDDDTVKKIRMDCCCQPPQGEKDRLKRMYEGSANLSDFVDKYNASHNLQSMWEENGTLYFSYPTCYCGCVKHFDAVIPKQWCYCTLGYTKQLFDYVLSSQVNVELIESIKAGGSRCVMCIKF